MRSYKEIEKLLRRRILDGHWPVNSLIPAEQDLAEELGTTRITVNRALQILADTGLVERKRRAGTRVKSTPSHETKVTITIVREDIEKSGAQYRYQPISSEITVPPAHIRTGLKLHANAKALHVMGLHFSNDTPYQFEDRWINLQTVPKARTGPFDQISPNEWLLQQIPFTSARHTFTAIAANSLEAKHLNLKKGDPVFVIERLTWFDQNTVTTVRMLHPGQSFQLVTEYLL